MTRVKYMYQIPGAVGTIKDQIAIEKCAATTKGGAPFINHVHRLFAYEKSCNIFMLGTDQLAQWILHSRYTFQTQFRSCIYPQFALLVCDYFQF